MEQKHTPGPWAWWTSNSFRRLSSQATGKDGDVLYGTVQRSDGHPDVELPNGGWNGPDGRLIAAAPDLLSALINTTERLKAAAIQSGTDPEFAEFAVRDARAAIAKATGQDSSLPPRQFTTWDGMYHDKCPDGDRCLRGCRSNEVCYWDQTETLHRDGSIAPAVPAQPVDATVYIQADHLEKAKRAPFLCRVEPTQRLPDFVPMHTAAATVAEPSEIVRNAIGGNGASFVSRKLGCTYQAALALCGLAGMYQGTVRANAVPQATNPASSERR